LNPNLAGNRKERCTPWQLAEVPIEEDTAKLPQRASFFSTEDRKT
jgi:hypothetical protein